MNKTTKNTKTQQPKTTTDARYLKTELKIQHAIEQLLKTHRTNLKVSDICALAHINPSTFYRHFSNPEDALVSLENSLLTNFQSQLNQISPHHPHPSKIFGLIFLFVYQNRSYFAPANHHHNYLLLTQIITIAKSPLTHSWLRTTKFDLTFSIYCNTAAGTIAYWGNSTKFNLDQIHRFVIYLNQITNSYRATT